MGNNIRFLLVKVKNKDLRATCPDLPLERGKYIWGYKTMYKSLKAVNSPRLLKIMVVPVLLTLWTGQASTQEDALEEILVTAERREVSLQDTAISITAFTGEQLAQAGVETSEQLTGFTPGLNIQRDVIGKVVMRGIGTENFTVAGDPGVAVSIDGAYLSRSNVAIFDLYDLDRVEILRGPQGTLYGRNATGGAINFITGKPTEEFDGYISADYGNYDKIRVEGAISGPIGDNISARLSGLSHNRDGFTDNIFPGVGSGLDELDDKDLWAIRGQLEFRPSDTLTVLVSADNYEDDSIASPYKYTADPLIYFGGAPFPNPLGSDLFTVSQGYELDTPGFPDWRAPSPGQASQTGVNGTITWDITPGLTVKSISAWRDMSFEWLNDGDGIEAYLVNYWQDDSSELFTQELQLLSDTGGKLNWIIGGYFLNEESDTRIGIPLP
ncbi:MAG: TonB-dependent receptor plug domain-containing protein, partial [Gammaproteobacteria bacterium]|nr:TonB-dependent receptor plug domain-containing protein [Gammaproteobacteria bacterium]